MGTASKAQGGSAARKRRRPRDRKAAILAAAAELFAERGYAAVNMGDIADAVGVTAPAIYRHYGGKLEVLEAVVLSAIELFRQPPPMGQGTDPEMRAAVLEAVGRALEHAPWLTVYEREARRLPAEARRQVREAEREISQSWLRRVQRRLPEVEHWRLLLRQQATIGAAIAVTTGAGAGTRMPELLTDGAVRLTLRDPSGDGGREANARTDTPWVPPPSRQENIVDVAVKLIRARGYQGVSTDEIGEAVGVSGPALYRYFPTKAALLVHAYDRAAARVVVESEQAVRSATSAGDALERLARGYIRVALSHRDLAVVTRREANNLPEEERARFKRLLASPRERWNHVVGLLRPELDESEAHSLRRAALGLVNWVVQQPDLAKLAPEPEDELVGCVTAFIGTRSS